MAISTRAVYFYNASKQITKRGTLTQTDSTHYVYSSTAAQIEQGDVAVTQLVLVLPQGTFSGGYPMVMFRTPKGYTSAMLSMSAAEWYITEDTTETLYQVFYITFNVVGWTYTAGVHAFMCGYLNNGSYDNLQASTYTVQDGVNNFDELDADVYGDIYASILATFSDVSERLTDIETYLSYITNYVADQTGADYVQYMTTPVTSQASLPIGATRWNPDEDCLETRLSADVVIQHGREMLRQARNNTGSTIADGKVVYVTGAVGQTPTIALADNGTYANADAIIGVTTQEIANNAVGEVCIGGIVNNLNTSAFADGDVVYLSTSGGITKTMPTAPSAIVRIGQILYSHSSLGKLLVDKQLHPRIADASDVKFTTIATNDIIIRDSDGYWKNIAKSVFQANCVKVDADNVMTGSNTFEQQVLMNGGIDNSDEKVVNVADGTNTKDAVNKGQLDAVESGAESYADAAVSTHNSSVVAHSYIQGLIEDLQLDVQRLDGRGVSYGEIPYDTATLQALDTATLDSTIIAAIQALAWGTGYTPTNGDLVYDTGVGSGVDYHEWEYNGAHWVDNGAINQPQATNTIYGNVKGDGTYLSIVAGLVQVLLSDYATHVGDTGASYTYTQIYNALAARYTSTEVDALLESIKIEANVTLTTLGSYTNGQTISFAGFSGYDEILIHAVNTNAENDHVSMVLNVNNLASDDIFMMHLIDTNSDITFDSWTVTCAADTVVYVYGKAYGTMQAQNVTYDNTTSGLTATDTQAAIDEVEGRLDTAEGDISDLLDGTQIANKATNDADGNDITDTYETKSDALLVKADVGAHEERIDNLEETLRTVSNGDTQATADDTDIISLGKDVANAPLQAVVDGMVLKATQIILNPGPFTATTGWNAGAATLSVSSNNLLMTGSGSSDYALLYRDLPEVAHAGGKWYRFVKVRVTNSLTTSIQLILDGSTAGTDKIAYTLSSPVANTWYYISFVGTMPADATGYNRVKIQANYASAANATGAVTEFAFVYEYLITPLISAKQYSPISDTTFDLMTDANIKTQMDAWVLDGTLPDDDLLSVGGNKRLTAVGKNLFNKTKYATSYAYKIRVLPSTAYVWSASTAYKTYDKDLNEVASGTATTLTTGSATKYIAFSGVANVDTFQLEYGSTATTYVPYASSELYLEGNANLHGVKGASLIQDTLEPRNGKYYYVNRVAVDTSVVKAATSWSITSVLTNTQLFYKSKASLGLTYPIPASSSTLANASLRIGNQVIALVTQSGVTADTENIFAINTSGDLLIRVNKTTYPNTAAFEAYLAANDVTFIYELATPVETEINTIGLLNGHGGGTVYVDDVMHAGVIYGTSAVIPNTSYPISSLDKVIKVSSDGTQTELATSAATIAGDGLSFTHTGLTAGDIVIFDWFYVQTADVKALTTITYYDNRFVVVDSVTSTVYKLTPAVASGVLSWTLTAI